MRQLVEACPRLEVIKRSVCIEGARRALACAKVHWGKLDGEKLVRDGPPPRKEHRKPENYYKDVFFLTVNCGAKPPQQIKTLLKK